MEQQKVKSFMGNFDRREFIQKTMMLLGAGAFAKFMTGCKDPDEEIDPGNGNGNGNGGGNNPNPGPTAKKVKDDIIAFIESLHNRGWTHDKAIEETTKFIVATNTKFASKFYVIYNVDNKGIVDVKPTVRGDSDVTVECAKRKTTTGYTPLLNGRAFDYHHVMECE